MVGKRRKTLGRKGVEPMDKALGHVSPNWDKAQFVNIGKMTG